MILDSSAIIAILKQEPDARRFSEAIEAAGAVQVSAATVLESSIVAGPHAQAHLTRLLGDARITTVPFDEKQAGVARRAYLEYGKRSGSAARLNFGDCFAYALAKTTGQPLLFKGKDFTHTDVVSAADSA